MKGQWRIALDEALGINPQTAEERAKSSIDNALRIMDEDFLNVWMRLPNVYPLLDDDGRKELGEITQSRLNNLARRLASEIGIDTANLHNLIVRATAVKKQPTAAEPAPEPPRSSLTTM